MTSNIESTTTSLYKIVSSSTTESNIGGRNVVSTGPLNKGQLLFEEEAFSVIPMKQHLVPPINYCALCCIHISNNNNGIECKYGCKLYFCSEECSNNMVHQLECSFVTKVWELAMTNGCDVTIALLAIRILMKKNVESDLYTSTVGQLSTLIDQFKRNQIKLMVKYYKFVDQLVTTIKEENPTLSSIFGRDEIINIVCALYVNSFAGLSDSDFKRSPISTGFYYKAALLNHSCEPNAFFSIQNNKLSMRIIRDIKKEGETIFDSYTDLLLPTFERQKILYQTKQFICSCNRCSDPTECKRYLSSIKCIGIGCENGYLSPKVFWNEKDQSIHRLWICESCKGEFKESDVEKIMDSLSKFNEFLGKDITQQIVGKTGSGDDGDITVDDIKPVIDNLNNESCKKILQVLHPNHYIRLQYHLVLSGLYDRSQKYLEAIEHCDQVVRIVSDILRDPSGELVDSLYQLGKLYEKLLILSSSTKQQSKEDLKKYLVNSNQNYKKSLEMSIICFGQEHPKTKKLYESVQRSKIE
eukprot:gene3078-3849_t